MNNGYVNGRVASEVKGFKNNDGSLTVLFTLAVPRNYKDKNGNVQTDFIQLQGYVPADKVNTNHRFTYLEKGLLIGVSFAIRSWSKTDANNNTKYGMSLCVENIDFLESKQTIESRKAKATVQA